MNQELPDVQAGFRKGRGTRDPIADIHWIIERERELKKKKHRQTNTYHRQTNIIDYTKAFECVDHDKLWKALRQMGVPEYLTCLLRNLYAGQEAAARTLYGQIDWFKIEKGVQQGCLLSPCLFNLYAKHIMRNARLGLVAS